MSGSPGPARRLDDAPTPTKEVSREAHTRHRPGHGHRRRTCGRLDRARVQQRRLDDFGPADHHGRKTSQGPRRGTDLSKRFARGRRDHRRSNPDRSRILLQPGAKGAGLCARLRLRDRQARRHRDQRSRCPGSQGHSRRLQRRCVLSGQAHRLGPVDRHRGGTREGCTGLPASAASIRRLGRAGRRSGVRDREPVRARADDDRRDRQRHGPGHSGSERSRDRERDPDGRADQPRQLRGTASRPCRRGDRHQFADSGRHCRRECGSRIRDPQCDRQIGLRAADRNRTCRACVARDRGRSDRPERREGRPRSAPARRRRRQGGQGKPCSQGRSQGCHAAGDRERRQWVRRRRCHRGSRTASPSPPPRSSATPLRCTSRATGSSSRSSAAGKAERSRSPSATLPSEKGGVR